MDRSPPGKQKRLPPPNYFSRKEQYRLLIMCATLMLVLVMMNEARKPQNWKWMWAGGPVPEVQNEPIDTRSEEESANKRVPVDAFKTTSLDNGTMLPNDVGEIVQDAELLPGINRPLLLPIEDNSILRVAENDAWKQIFNVLNETTQADVENASIGEVSFAQLFRQTDFYRGKVVEVSGTIRRAERIVPRDVENGITELFRWIVEPAGPSNAPIVVYSIEKPDEFEIGDGLREDATFHAVCFKRWAYAAGDGTRIAPLLLAKTANWKPTPPPQPVELPATPAVVITLIGLGLLAAAIAMFAYRSTVATTPELERMREPIHAPGEQLQEDEVLPAVGESLRLLAQNEHEPDA